MRGSYSAKTKVAHFLNELNKGGLHKEGLDEKTIKEKTRALTKKGFKASIQSEDKLHEWQYQARMINDMRDNKALKSFLKVDNLFFIASEFILSGGGKIDIVGYDGGNHVFFFELKTPSNKKDNPVVEVINYMETYGITKRDETIEVLFNYPINSIKTKDVEFHGYAVYGYSKELDVAKSKQFKSIEEPGVIQFIC